MFRCGNTNVLDYRYRSVPSGVVLSDMYDRYHCMYFPEISKSLNPRTHLTPKVLGKRMGSHCVECVYSKDKEVHGGRVSWKNWNVNHGNT